MTIKKVLLLGGYGNFGSYIAKILSARDDCKILIAGRSLEKANIFAKSLEASNVEAVKLDIDDDFQNNLAKFTPSILVHTIGPFQGQDYRVAQACIAVGCHYLDLADATDFVSNISQLDEAAKTAGTAIISGVSSVPCLTAAIIDHYLSHFKDLREIDYGISAAQQTNRGLSTVSAILSYIGKPFLTIDGGVMRTIYGWQKLKAINYPEIGWRLHGNCDVPDLALFPQRYPSLVTLRFSAGHENILFHLGLYLISWLVRSGVIANAQIFSKFLFEASFLFDFMGTSRSGFHMIMKGIDYSEREITKKFFLIAKSAHGPVIPCLDMISLDDYIQAMKPYDITVYQA